MVAFLIFGIFFQQSGGGLTVESVHTLFSNVQAAALTAEHRLLVTDSEQHAVLIVGTDLRIERTVGRKGWGNDAFDDPSDISSTFLLEILVTDRTNERIQHYDKDMLYVRTYDRNSLGLDSPLRPVACVQSNQGEIFILDAEERRVLRTDVRGRIIGTFGVGNRPFLSPIDIAVTENDMLFVLDGNSIHQFDTFGNLLRSLPMPSGKGWNSISYNQGMLIVTSPSRIILHDVTTGAERAIVPSDLIGVPADIQFRAALFTGDIMNILTESTLYRCTMSDPSH